MHPYTGLDSGLLNVLLNTARVYISASLYSEVNGKWL